jgi:hypothetical protein
MANLPSNPTPAARPAQTGGERSDKPSGSQPSRDRSKVGDEDRRDSEDQKRVDQIKEQTRARSVTDVKPRDVAENRDPEERDDRPGHKERTSGGRMTVQALKDLWYQNNRIRAGEVFTLKDAKKFKANQMVQVSDEHLPAKLAKRAAERKAKATEFGLAPVEEGMIPAMFAGTDGLTPGQRKDHDFGNAPVKDVDPEALPTPGERPSVPPALAPPEPSEAQPKT